MSNGQMIHVVAAVHGCDAEVYLNDVPVGRLLEHQGAALSLPVHPLIVKGTNELRLLINPGPEPAQARLAGAGASIKPVASAYARLMLVPLGAAPSADGQVFLDVSFRADAQIVGHGPFAVHANSALPLTFGKRVWETAAQNLAITPEIEASALGFVNQVREVLQRGEPKRLAAFVRPKILDAAASYGIDGEQEVAAFVSEWESYAKTPNWKLAPVVAEHASLRLCGGGRFIECIAKDWSPLIRSDDLAAGGVLMGMGIAWINGQWAIVY